MAPWGQTGCAGGRARRAHRSCRGAERLTDEGEKRLVVERLHEEGERAAFQRGRANAGCFPSGDHDDFRIW